MDKHCSATDWLSGLSVLKMTFSLSCRTQISKETITIYSRSFTELQKFLILSNKIPSKNFFSPNVRFFCCSCRVSLRPSMPSRYNYNFLFSLWILAPKLFLHVWQEVKWNIWIPRFRWENSCWIHFFADCFSHIADTLQLSSDRYQLLSTLIVWCHYVKQLTSLHIQYVRSTAAVIVIQVKFSFLEFRKPFAIRTASNRIVSISLVNRLLRFCYFLKICSCILFVTIFFAFFSTQDK